VFTNFIDYKDGSLSSLGKVKGLGIISVTNWKLSKKCNRDDELIIYGHDNKLAILETTKRTTI
jgi:hypothetical protein